jgi:DNA invertase Pin-like site-specific DNA recombinase
MTMRAAMYLRVSTDGQTVENQRHTLTEVAERRGWQVAQVYEDNGISGARGRERRPALNNLLKDAARRRFDVLLIAAVDRLGRSVAHVAGALSDMQAAGVVVYAHREGMDGTTPYGRAMLGMAAVFAELEREMIRDRVRAGLARARAEGATLGRPVIAAKVKAEVRKLRTEGNSLRATARLAGIAVSSVQAIIREVPAT